jgi:hypothetical protein
MFKRKAQPVQQGPTLTEQQVIAALNKIALGIERQRLEAAALRRVIEAATGYEHPASAARKLRDQINDGAVKH